MSHQAINMTFNARSSCAGGDCCSDKVDRRQFIKIAGMSTAALASCGGLTGDGAALGAVEDIDHFVPADKHLDSNWVASLFERGEPCWHAGDELKTIGMPIGGICAGQVYLTGQGRLLFWDVLNKHWSTLDGRANYLRDRPPATTVKDGSDMQEITAMPMVDQGFALRIGSGAVVRMLDGTGFSDVRFCGEYPVGLVEYVDQSVPVKVSLEAFSPFIPLNALDSALPATVLNYCLENTSQADVQVSLVGWLENIACRYSGEKFGSQLRRKNRLIKDKDMTSLSCEIQAGQVAEDKRGDLQHDPAVQGDYGTMALCVLGDGIGSAAISDGPMPDALFDNNGSGALTTESATEKPVDQKLRGAVGRTLHLKPGEKARITFVVTWCMPHRWLEDRYVGNYYGEKFGSAVDVARYLVDNLTRLSDQTRIWHDTYYDSTLPRWLLDRLHSTVSNLATTTCFWWADGRFWAYEGVGCCHGTCGHVWNYAHALARLFPSLERSVRERQDFAVGVGLNGETGAISFRGERWDMWAADAQGGYILKAYREHQISANSEFLERNWSSIRKATEFLIQQDPDRDGLIEGRQHQTYDQDYYGANTMVGSMYLGGLAAAEQMAKAVGDNAFAVQCRKILDSGSRVTVERLFNGEYFIQDVDLERHPQWQYANGCLSDHLFGQGWAHQLGLGYIYPRQTVESGLQSVWKYCWAPDVALQHKVHAPFRKYADPGEAGLLLCTWPKSKHLGPQSTLYRNEVWTGVEYQVAGHMAWEGMVTESLVICRAVHDRYHPSKRNPWNEIECGDHYARALASWGVLIGLSGFEYHGPENHIGFAPRITPDNFCCVFTAAQGWGSIAQKRNKKQQSNQIEVKWGKLGINSLTFELPQDTKLTGAEVRTAQDQNLVIESHQQGNRVTLTMEDRITVGTGEAIMVDLIYS